ncbi:MAG: hypothetical protein RMM58_14210 [Chloroflexota bacterium]|nr:hypothetical protein [Dehalococcoidia bacterium]MDW8255026.1 hypothetical protein [Chloroflexota bacterium]
MTTISPELGLRKRYQLFRPLGEDESAEIFFARDLADDAPVRVRLFHPDAFPTREARRAAMHQLAAALDWKQPGALALRELGFEGERLYTVTERPRGALLRERLTRGEPMALALAASVVERALDVVEAAIVAGISHPGLTPDNIFLNPFGGVEVGDFGQPVALAPLGAAVAPALYVRPPEMTTGRPATVAEHLYSAAALLLWLVGGKPPFPGETPDQVLRRHRNTIAPSLAMMTPEAPDELVRAVARSLRKDPAGRPTTIAVLRAPLRHAAKSADWPVASLAEPALPPEEPRRRRWQWRLPFRR